MSLISDGLMMVNTLIAAVEKATGAGTQFVFGFLGGGVTPFDVTDSNQMFVFAFQVLAPSANFYRPSRTVLALAGITILSEANGLVSFTNL